MDAGRRGQNENAEALAAVGVSLTPSHLISGERRLRLENIEAYGPEERPRHYRVPLVAFVTSTVLMVSAFALFEGLDNMPGLVVFGLGVLLGLDATVLTVMARREPTLEILTSGGYRHVVRLPSQALMPQLLTALDEALGGGGRR